MSIRLRKKLKIMDQSKSDEDLGVMKMFKFKRIRCCNNNNSSKKQDVINSEETSLRSSSNNQASTNLSNLKQNENMICRIPKKRSGHRAVCDEENLWIWGGYCPNENTENNNNNETDENTESTDSPMLSELFRFNFATRKWYFLKTSGDPPQDTVASHSAILHKNLLIVFGGTGFPFGQKLSNSLHICNLKTLVWKKYKIKGERPLPLYGSSLLMVDNYLYILFGTNSQRYCSNVYKVDIKTLESVKLFDSLELLDTSNYTSLLRLNQQYPNDFLMGRYRQEVVLHENKIYVFGGGKHDGDAYSLKEIDHFRLKSIQMKLRSSIKYSSYSNSNSHLILLNFKLPVFNLQTNVWEFVNTLADLKTNTFPQNRKFHSCIKIDIYVYVIGGMCCNLNENVLSLVDNCIWRLNLIELRWEKLEIEMPCLTFFHASCVNQEGQVFIHGGIKTSTWLTDQTRINHLYTINLKIPKLSEMCWNSLINNYPNILNSSKQTLFDAGFPNNFVNRIN